MTQNAQTDGREFANLDDAMDSDRLVTDPISKLLSKMYDASTAERPETTFDNTLVDEALRAVTEVYQDYYLTGYPAGYDQVYRTGNYSVMDINDGMEKPTKDWNHGVKSTGQPKSTMQPFWSSTRNQEVKPI